MNVCLYVLYRIFNYAIDHLMIFRKVSEESVYIYHVFRLVFRKGFLSMCFRIQDTMLYVKP